jgi:hypothetical protein
MARHVLETEEVITVLGKYRRSRVSSLGLDLVNREFINILLVSPLIEDHLALTSLIGHSNWGLHHAFGCADAMALLKECPIPVAICDCEILDGTWQDFWSGLSGLPSPPRLIVSSRVADNRLWGEVLSLGAYDLLTKPFEASELFRVGFLAWHSWANQYGRRPKPPAVVNAPRMEGQGLRAATIG